MAATMQRVRLATGSSKTVTVACKVPMGLYLKLYKSRIAQEPVMGGGTREVKIFDQQLGDTVRVNGPSVPHGMTPKYQIVGRYALTRDIDAEFFAAWMEQNADHEAVRNHLIWAQETNQAARDEAKEKRAVLSGMEPVNVDMVTEKGRVRLADKRMPSAGERGRNLSAILPASKDDE